MDVDSLLRHHGLRVTGTRRAVLRLLQGSPRALSQHDVETALPGIADRVTLFRVLQAFEEAGLAHRVMDAQGVACYAACADGCDTHHHSDAHAHFHCGACGAVYCLDDVVLPKVKVPKGFKVKESHLAVEGRCAGCAEA
jgi:Fur family ferric uptake transcriptional regulator